MLLGKSVSSSDHHLMGCRQKVMYIYIYIYKRVVAIRFGSLKSDVLDICPKPDVFGHCSKVAVLWVHWAEVVD